ncbi:MAG TPA: hypothetical protein VGK40_10905 [Verrucomicrobiae bacterium]|jgi:hypothetical protein
MNTNESFCRPAAFLSPLCFAHRGNPHVDEATPRVPELQRVRIRFDSREFFDLLARYPKLLPYLAAGRNVQLALGGRVYEVYE